MISEGREDNLDLQDEDGWFKELEDDQAMRGIASGERKKAGW